MNQSMLPGSDDEEHVLGHGFYNKHSHAQGEANTYGLPLIVEGINRIAYLEKAVIQFDDSN